MINYDKFLSWAEDNFDIVNTINDEVKVNSIFTEDTKCHLWCNPSKNAYHCWKTNNSGNLFELVILVNKCSYSEAVRILSDTNILRSLEERVTKLLAKPKEQFNGEIALQPPSLPNEIELPKDTFLINSLPDDNHFRIRAEKYLKDRKLETDNLYMCIGGSYCNRIVIPYYAPDGTLIYWNTRDITGKSSLRYRGPDKDIGVGKSQVIWMNTWPKSNSKIYLTEGEFDAMTLTKCGFVAGAMGGKNLHHRQIELLHSKQYQQVKSYKICLSLDTDKSGKEALNRLGNDLIKNGIQVSYVRPPVNCKDWNDLLVKEGERIVMLYIMTNEKPFNYINRAHLY